MSGNSIGRLFTVTTFGESHGPALGCIVDGCPPGLELSEADLQGDVDRRRTGTSQFVSQRKRRRRGQDPFRRVRRQDHGHAPSASSSRTPTRVRATTRRSRTAFVPGHADYTYQQKYGFRDYRGGGRSSARETVMRVAAGAIARKYLHTRLGVSISGYLSQIGSLTHRSGQSRGGLRQSVLLPGSRRACQELEDAHVEDPRRWRFGRREGHGDGARRAARPGRAGVRPARCRPRARHDGHQRGEGRGDRRRRGFGCAERQRASRRAHAHGFPEQQRRRHSRRHFLGAGHRRARRRSSPPRASRFRARPSTSRAIPWKSSRPAGTIPAWACAPRPSAKPCWRSC